MMISRDLEPHLIAAAASFPVVALLGPRQSGKTTLAQKAFPHHRYVSLEDFNIQQLALADPQRFLTEYPSQAGLILDEIQHVPQLLSSMQTIVDREKRRGFYVITGSQNFLVNEAVSQTLAGRIALLTLLPLSINELKVASLLPDRIETAVFNGSFPRIYADDVRPEKLYPNYIRTYVERDVRQIKNIGDLSTFQKFLGLCAGRVGQLLNLSSLGNDCGINHSTAKSWISLLEASYVVFLLHPYYKNFGKRLIKAPKLYFVDSGLACSLLRIRSADELAEHYSRGSLIESFIISDLLKQQYNLDLTPSLYFWRDHSGQEIDCIIEEPPFPVPLEIKAGKTAASDFFKEIASWKKISQAPASSLSYVVYGGSENQNWPEAPLVSWKSAGHIITDIIQHL